MFDRFIRLYPSVPAGVAFMLGIALSQTLPITPALWLACSVFTFAILLLSHRLQLQRCFVAFLVAAFTSLGLFLGQTAQHQFTDDQVGRFVSDTPQLARLRLYLPHEPELRAQSFGQRLVTPQRQATIASAREILTTAGWQPCDGEILVQIQQPHARLAAGQTIEALGFLQQPGKAANPGQFDWQHYYRRQGILASLVIRESAQIAILKEASPPLLTTLRSRVRQLLSAGFEQEQRVDHALLQMLLLGDYDPELRDIRDQFRATGTGHHLAISGMHVAVAGAFVLCMLRLIGLSLRTSWFIAALFVVMYGAVAMPSASVLRSVILFVIASMVLLARRSSHAVQLLFVAAIALLFFQPLDLFDAGFQLSFGTVLALVLLTRPITMLLLGRRDPLLIHKEIELLPDLVRVGRWMDEKTLAIACAGIVAWLASMPLVGIHFSQLNPWQVPASILLAPLVAFTIVAGVAKVLVSAIVPPLSGVMADIAGFGAWTMRVSAEQLARLPASDVPLPAPSAFIAILCWASMIAAVVRWPLSSMRWAARLSVPVCFSIMLVGPYIGWTTAPGHGPSTSLRVTLMSVGAGQVALIESPGSARPTLIDCGSSSLSDLFSNAIQPVLRDAGVTRLGRVFISHSNTDHFSAAAEVVDAYDATEVLVSRGFDDIETPESRTMLRLLQQLDRPPREVRAGDVIPLGEQTSIRVLGPDDKSLTGFELNDRSLVLKLEHAGRSILFPGDIQNMGMRRLLSNDPEILRADVLVAPHHGSVERTTGDFIRAVGPDVIVSSNDRTLSTKQKDFDVLVKSMNLRFLRTHSSGAITIEINSKGEVFVVPFLQ